MAKVSYPDIDKLFEKMDRETANKMSSNVPTKKKKTTPKKKVAKKK